MNYLDNKVDFVLSVTIALALVLMVIPALMLLSSIIAIHLVGYEAYYVASVISDWVTLTTMNIYYTALGSTFLTGFVCNVYNNIRLRQILREDKE